MKAFFYILVLNSLFSFSQTKWNVLDDKGQKHGLWKGVFAESQRPRYEGTFNHGEETGIFTYFDDTKAQSIIATRTFNPTDHSAYTIFYDQKKNKVSEGKVVNKLYEGEWKYYHEASPIIMTIEYYSKGKLNGKRTVYYPSSKIAEDANYLDGKKEGSYMKYTEKGIVLEDSNYKNGEYNGPCVYKDPNGLIVAQGNYKAGMKTGNWQFFENGKLLSSENKPKVKKVVKAKSK